MCSEVQYNRASQSQGSAACKMPGMRPGCGAAFQAAEPQPNDRRIEPRRRGGAEKTNKRSPQRRLKAGGWSFYIFKLICWISRDLTGNVAFR
jgi:hypothetical protein